MLNALIVEDDAEVAAILRDLVEIDGRLRVVAIADDAASSALAVTEHRIDCALVDIQLAHQSSGYGIACDLTRHGIVCLFVTGHAPPFPIPEFALGCISKPWSVNAVSQALDAIVAARGGGEGPSAPAPGFSEFQRY
ncbi:response regulator [Sphingopyxis sp. J-6]|uniref:response regulator n=1 Tax=Sphingopyxis sp. J-6 TaxID=3122054 RepID=UPI00398433DF